MKEGTLNEIHSVPIGGKHVDISVSVKKLWSGAKPTASDLLREMENPSQVMMEKDKYYIARKLLPLSPRCAILIQEAASKPPDFQPLLTAEEMKDLPAKVSKRRFRQKHK